MTLKPMGVDRDQRWPWWPLLPLYPYGRRRTLVRELIPGELWVFEQLQGIYYVAVPIRMTVLKLRQGLLVYAPVAATAELVTELRRLEQLHGPVCTIVLPTSSGLEHKLLVPALARAFPAAMVWVSPGQWSFPLNLSLSWLGFPRGRTRVLFEDGLPHTDELSWHPLGPLDLGVGVFMEVGCYHRASGTLLVTDALVAIPHEPPPLFEADPTPLLFHARERGDEPLLDGPEQRRKGWRRLVLFASYLRPEHLSTRSLGQMLAHVLRPGLRSPRSHFGLYPFAWQSGWESEFEALLAQAEVGFQVAPVLERLVFPRHRQQLVGWLRQLSTLEGCRRLVAAHHGAPVDCTALDFQALAEQLEQRPWAPDQGPWEFLARLDSQLLAWGVVPQASGE